MTDKASTSDISSHGVNFRKIALRKRVVHVQAKRGLGKVLYEKIHMYKTTYLPREFDFAAPTGDYYLYSKYYILYMFIGCIAYHLIHLIA